MYVPFTFGRLCIWPMVKQDKPFLFENTHGHTLRAAVNKWYFLGGGGRSAISTKTRQFTHHNNFSGLLRTDWCCYTCAQNIKGQWIPPQRAKLAWSNIKLCAPSHIKIYPAILLIFKNCIAQNSLKELISKAEQTTKRNIGSCQVCRVCSLQPSSIDWLDKCMFPDISLRLCVQMMMLVSRGIGGHLLPWHAVAGGEQVWGRGHVAGEEWINTDGQADR